MMNNTPISEIQIKQHTKPSDTNDDDTNLETKTEPDETKDNNHESYQKETILQKKSMRTLDNLMKLGTLATTQKLVTTLKH